jgi:ribosomal protein S26
MFIYNKLQQFISHATIAYCISPAIFIKVVRFMLKARKDLMQAIFPYTQ